MPKCPIGSIYRKGYYRNGKYIKPKCISDPGRVGKNTIKPGESGSLVYSYGYNANKSDAMRKKALNAALKKETYRKLIAELLHLRKNSNSLVQKVRISKDLEHVGDRGSSRKLHRMRKKSLRKTRSRRKFGSRKRRKTSSRKRRKTSSRKRRKTSSRKRSSSRKRRKSRSRRR